jgi:enoyl-CoA hydratase/carnithine racemase
VTSGVVATSGRSRMTANVAESGVELQVCGPVATLALHNPQKRNALGFQTWGALPGLIATAERDAVVRLILVRGNGGHFGSGNDIAELAALNADAALAFARTVAEATRAIEAASKPVVMAIEGACYGGSVALALAGDVRVASSNAVFAVTPAKLGLLYLRSDLRRLIAAIGVSQSKRLIYSAAPIDAATAAMIGLVDDVFPSDRFELSLSRLIDAIVEGSPFTLRHMKEMLRSLDAANSSPETEASVGLFAAATQGADFKEGHSAFLARRPPRFR